MIPSLTIHPDEIPLRLDPDGSVHVGSSRVLFAVLLNAHRDWGWSAEQLADEFPSITLAEAHAALAYYLNHRAEVEAFLKAWNAAGERSRDAAEARPEYQSLRARLVAAREARVGT